MDGIPVKISEKYKPPRKVTIPSNVENRFNCEIKYEEYDFSLERTVVEQMAKLKEARRKIEEESRPQKKAEDIQGATESTQRLTLQSSPPPVSQNPILTPVPITPRTDSKKEIPIGPINFSDFESDTSSPFDNMELKTINDLEELAHVLGSNQPEKLDKSVEPLNGFTHSSVDWNSSYVKANWFNNAIPLQSYVIQRVQSPSFSPSQSVSSSTFPSIPLSQASPSQPTTDSTDTSVTEIMRQLQTQLKEYQASSQSKVPTPSLSPPPSSSKQMKKIGEAKPSTLPNPLSQLSQPCKNLARRVAEMGFHLPRCARAVQLFGNDEARVIEFLLQVQKLEEMDIPSDRAEKALVTNSYSEENTLHYLNSLNQLMALGFREEKVVQALARFNNDRDKALDYLIS